MGSSLPPCLIATYVKHRTVQKNSRFYLNSDLLGSICELLFEKFSVCEHCYFEFGCIFQNNHVNPKCFVFKKIVCMLQNNCLYFEFVVDCSLRYRQREVKGKRVGATLRDMVKRRMSPLLTNQMINIWKKHVNCQMHLENTWYYFLLLSIT
uniref:Uncharacterized protein n=1 Tax=Arundo donax TaxID=35708 RepID=A0A0A9A9D9_ARUDO